jgi:hypothetical protein
MKILICEKVNDPYWLYGIICDFELERIWKETGVAYFR